MTFPVTVGNNFLVRSDAWYLKGKGRTHNIVFVAPHFGSSIYTPPNKRPLDARLETQPEERSYLGIIV